MFANRLVKQEGKPVCVFCSALMDKRDWEEKQNKRDGCALAQYKKLTGSSTEFLCGNINSFDSAL